MSAADELAKLGPLGELKSDTMGAFGAFNTAAMADGEVSAKTKELIAGATDGELAEVTFVAAALRAGAAITHGANHVIGK